MGFVGRVLFVILSLLTAVAFQNYKNMSRPLPPPKLDLNEYWGPGNGSSYKEDTSIKPFVINYKAEIEDLRQQLSRPLKVQESLEGVAFEYGFNSKMTKMVIRYWRDIYLERWNDRQQYLNQFPQFTTQIQGLNIHYLHVKPKNVGKNRVYPLLLLHGWPGSVREFYEFIPLLARTTMEHDIGFEVIAPSLVGYGWSEGAHKKNFGPAQMAVVFRNLMLRLGHEKFFIQGGDWGSIIGKNLASFFPENTLGYHSNMCFSDGPLANIKLFISSLYPSLFYEKEQEKFHLPALPKLAYLIEESGYMHLQATKPDTIGTTLLNSPVGLAIYIIEKFSTWTNVDYRNRIDGGFENQFSYDSLLDNIMIYYLSNSITTSQRLYAEAFAKPQRDLNLNQVPVTVPVGCARFRHDLAHSSDWQLKEVFPNLVHSTYHDVGGHFIAMEKPNTLHRDFFKFIRKVVG